jgi:predicted glycosyltransferase involved in capsule biosynthesis
MFDEYATHDTIKTNLELLCDVEVFLCLTYIIPMLEIVQGLSKFVQNWNIFICVFYDVVKECEGKLCKMYCGQQTMYG